MSECVDFRSKNSSMEYLVELVEEKLEMPTKILIRFTPKYQCELFILVIKYT